MHQFQLTQKEEIELRVAHRRAKKKKEVDRMKSLVLLGSGWTYKKVSDLNLIDRLWKFFRKKVTKGQYYEKFGEFKLACEKFFKDLKRYKPELDSLLTENFQIIGIKNT